MRGGRIWWPLVLAGVLSGWWLGRQHVVAPASAAVAVLPDAATTGAAPTPAQSPSVASHDGSPAVAASAAATAASRATVITTALPPANTPLARIVDDLSARASAGDGPAAMRLYRELERCRMERVVSQFSALSRKQLLTRALQPEQLQRLAQSQAQRQVQSCFAQQICAGITPQQEAQAVSRLVQAASLGDLDARASFATGAFIHNGDLDALQYVPLFRSQAVAWARQAAEVGRQDALSALGRAYAGADFGFQSPLGQLVAQDRILGASYLHAALLARTGGRTSAGVPKPDLELQIGVELSDSERSAAIEQGEAFYQEHLRGLPPEPGPAAYGLNPTPAEIARLAPQCLAEPTR